ncbi:2',5'-phosphodiesterase 12-like isoform X2 [Watersipora subatra]
MTGFPVIPEFTLEFADRLECDFEWSQAAVPEVLIGCDFLYTPTVKDIGHRLTLTIIPKRGDRQGFSVTVVSDSEVKTGPDLLPILSRQNLPVKDTSVNNCRVVSYNLLAHTYTDTEFSRKELFSHCPVGYLEYDYRKSLIAKELLGYNADVICLQEVDNSQFSNYYQPLFRFHGYSSFLCSKRHYKIPKNWHAVEEEPTVNMDCEEKGDESLTEASVGTEGEGQIICSEGSAILFKDSKFRLVADCTINIATALETDSRYADIKEAAMNSRLVTEKLFYRSGCCVQTVVLESRDDKSKRLCLATTHLYFHPLGSVVRLLQTAVALRHIHSVKSSYKSEGCSMPVLFCGDFNSAPNSKIVQLVRSRGVSDNDGVWNENALYSMEGVNLQHSLYLETACGFPKYTNYVPQFKECIDYIFYEKHCFSVESVTSLPSEEFMASHRNGIPSENFPSDHLALCCELSWLPLE